MAADQVSPASQGADNAKLDALARMGLGGHASQTHHPDVTRQRAVDALVMDLSSESERDFGDYELMELIGKGGMGVVYRAYQKSLDRQVAIKLLIDGIWAAPEFVERLRREARAAARMNHPNIVEIFETGEHQGLHYVSMQLVSEGTLADLLRSPERPNHRDSALLLETIAEAVDYAHRLGILHLDLKPANILMRDQSRPMIADFGLAQRLNEIQVDGDQEPCGTPSYMAPEQVVAAHSPLTARTDVYALGCILYECLTGARPLDAPTADATMERVLKDAPLHPRQLSPSVPRDLEGICLRCLAKDPASRYESAGALARDLRRYLDGAATEAVPATSIARLKRVIKRSAITFAGLLSAGTVATGVLVFFGLFAIYDENLRRTESVAAKLMMDTLSDDPRHLKAASESLDNQETFVPGVSNAVGLDLNPAEVVTRVLQSLAEQLGRRKASPGMEWFILRGTTQEKIWSLRVADYVSKGRHTFIQWHQLIKSEQPRGSVILASIPAFRSAKRFEEACNEYSVRSPGCPLTKSKIEGFSPTLIQAWARLNSEEIERVAQDLSKDHAFVAFVESRGASTKEVSRALVADLTDLFPLTKMSASDWGRILDLRTCHETSNIDQSGGSDAVERCADRVALALQNAYDPLSVGLLLDYSEQLQDDFGVAVPGSIDPAQWQQQWDAFEQFAQWCVPLREYSTFVQKFSTTPTIELVSRSVRSYDSCFGMDR